MNEVRLRNMLQVQLAMDYNCYLDDFANTNTLITSKIRSPERRLFEDEDSIADIAVHEGKLIASVEDEFFDAAEEFFQDAEGEWFFDTYDLIAFDRVLNGFGYEVGPARIGFIPRSRAALRLPKPPELHTSIIEGRELQRFRNDERFNEALLFSEVTPDMLAVAAYNEFGGVIGMAGASRNCAAMWEMGVNVLPEARQTGLAALLVSMLANEILERGRLPYFNACMSHLGAQRTALAAGLYPAFCEVRSRRFELDSPFEDE